MRLRFIPLSILAVALAAGGLLGGAAAAAPAGATATTVLLVRHAEKAALPADDPPLSDLGQQRVEALGRMVADAGITRIFASDKRRTQQTVAPLADRLGLAVEVVAAKDAAGLAAAIRSRPGGVVLVAGHSNTLGPIAGALGAPEPPEISEADYDTLYVVTVPVEGPATLVRLRWAP